MGGVLAKPFVKWVGGKRQLLRQFREFGLYPKGFDEQKNTYYEPFVGGGAVFFELAPPQAIISDINKDLIITYEVVRDRVDELIKSLRGHINTKDYYLMMRAKNPAKMSDVEVASRFIYLNRTCFNGMYRVNSKGQFNVPYGKYIHPVICDECNLRAASDALKNVNVLYANYHDAIASAKAGDFVYLDPPYYPLNATSSFTSYTKQGFLAKEQEELRDAYVELSKRGCYVMESNSNTEFIRKLYCNIDNVSIHEVYAARAINANAYGRGKIKELVITNY